MDRTWLRIHGRRRQDSHVARKPRLVLEELQQHREPETRCAALVCDELLVGVHYAIRSSVPTPDAPGASFRWILHDDAGDDRNRWPELSTQ
jgi:hypothetical protein